MNPPIHVSGHASVEELTLMLNLVRPKYFVPIHGEYRQMAKHRRLAEHLRHSGLKDSFILESGTTLEIDEQGARIGEKVTVGRVCIDSGTVGEVVEDVIIRDRRHLSEDGIVLPIYVADSARSHHAHCLRLARWCGFDLTEDAGGALHFGAFTRTAADHTFRFGADIVSAAESP